MTSNPNGNIAMAPDGGRSAGEMGIGLVGRRRQYMDMVIGIQIPLRKKVEWYQHYQYLWQQKSTRSFSASFNFSGTKNIVAYATHSKHVSFVVS
jgi:hypothetical protein